LKKKQNKEDTMVGKSYSSLKISIYYWEHKWITIILVKT
jgi:hypothetical protein